MNSKYVGIVMLLGLILTVPFSRVNGEELQAVQFSSRGHQPRLMEVYVSQGCSSCPPAQEWVNALVDDPGLWTEIIPIVFHVHYWDYIGWKDPFAFPAFTQRQYEYKSHGNVGSVYTPGFVVNGKEWRGWFQRRSLPEGNTQTDSVLNAQLKEGKLFADYSAPSGNQRLNVAVLGFGFNTNVTRGENRNRNLKEDFTVIAYEQYTSDNGRWKVALPKPSVRGANRLALAIWVSNKNDPTPLQATGGWLPQH